MDGPGKGLYFSHMRRRQDARPNRAIRTWSLYGEADDGMLVDWVHAEPIQDRSRTHDYSIDPHRHALLFQIFWISGGRAELVLEDGRHALAPPVALTLPPLTVHGFEFSSDVAGTVISVFDRELDAILTAAPGFRGHFARMRIVPLGGHADEARAIGTGMEGIARELAGRRLGRDLMLRAELGRMLAALRRVEAREEERLRGGGAPSGEGRAVSLVVAFQQLVEEEFAGHRPVAHYAERLGITAGHLNRVCRMVIDASALDVINRRLVLEAKRQLAFTGFGIKQISAHLGFEDPAYFSRFFTRETGLSPSAFREALLAENG
jgi:AraC family transcriptional activator of pobA